MQPLNTTIFIFVAVSVTALHIFIILHGSRGLSPRQTTTAQRLQPPPQPLPQLRSPVKQIQRNQEVLAQEVQKIDEILRSIEERLKTPQPPTQSQATESGSPPEEGLNLDLSQLKDLLTLAKDLREEVARIAGKTLSQRQYNNT